MFWSHAGIVQASRNAVGIDDLPILVLQQVAVRPVQHAGMARAQRRGMFARLYALASSFHANKLHFGIVRERMEESDCVAAAAYAGHGEQLEAFSL